METKQIAWTTGSGNITLTYQGLGDGTINVQSDANDICSARSQTIFVETTAGSPVVTKSLTVTQGACPVPVGTVLDYAYTGSYQEVELPAGQYKLQCWGAQGGSNAAASSYNITAKAGGKGGYSEGIITLSSPTTVRVYVGGQGSSSAGGFNGGGSTSGSASYNSGDEQGVSRMGGGGGATDIRLSDGALLSRMIVAGGGSGGAMCYQKKTTSSTSWVNKGSLTFSSGVASGTVNGVSYIQSKSHYTYWSVFVVFNNLVFSAGDSIRVTLSPSITGNARICAKTKQTWEGAEVSYKMFKSSTTYTIPSGASYLSVSFSGDSSNTDYYSGTLTFERSESSSSTSTSNDSHIGYVGGGTNGDGYSSTYKGTQNAAGSGGSFGQGANQSATNYRYCSGAGGGGWYGGGGGQYSDSTMDYCKYSGGGSGFVNTPASAGNRPSGYTGLELDSGTTFAGNTSFESTSGGTETGHAGNGYARITRLDPNIMQFGYTGAVQSQTLKAGKYKIECWGAQGGSYNTTYYGGKGGYSVGEINITEPTTVYIYVGGEGTGGTTAGAKAGGFNGGGLGYSTSTTYIECGGGGASDVRIGQDSLYARVIVAGGGGGAGSYSASYRYAGGAGGGTSGATPSQYSTSYKAGTGGTATARGNSYYGSTANSATYGTLAAFGVGAGANSGITTYPITGGGAGWYGGGYSRRGAGGGGSGYVYTSSTASNYPSGCLLDTTMYLTDAQTIAGSTSFPSKSGSTETGHEGNGYVRITKIS